MFKERQELGDRHKVQKVGRPGDLEQGGRERVVCDGVCGSWREASGRNPLSCCFTERRLLGAKGKRNHQEGNAGQEARRGGCPWSTPLQLQLLWEWGLALSGEIQPPQLHCPLTSRLCLLTHPSSQLFSPWWQDFVSLCNQSHAGFTLLSLHLDHSHPHTACWVPAYLLSSSFSVFSLLKSSMFVPTFSPYLAMVSLYSGKSAPSAHSDATKSKWASGTTSSKQVNPLIPDQATPIAPCVPSLKMKAPGACRACFSPSKKQAPSWIRDRIEQ